MKIPTIERRNKITNLLIKNGYVRAVHLAKQFQVSMETIRKDLCFLGTSSIMERRGPTTHSYQEFRSQIDHDSSQ